MDDFFFQNRLTFLKISELFSNAMNLFKLTNFFCQWTNFFSTVNFFYILMSILNRLTLLHTVASKCWSFGQGRHRVGQPIKEIVASHSTIASSCIVALIFFLFFSLRIPRIKEPTDRHLPKRIPLNTCILGATSTQFIKTDTTKYLYACLTLFMRTDNFKYLWHVCIRIETDAIQ